MNPQLDQLSPPFQIEKKNIFLKKMAWEYR